MSLHRFAPPVSAVVMASAVLAALAVAQATFTPYKATDAPVNFGLWQPGITTQADGQTHIREFTAFYTRRPFDGESLDHRVSGGTIRFNMNFNLDQNRSGPIWGTGHWAIGDGSWEGNFEGKTNTLTHVGYYDAVWHGGGTFLGLQLKESCVYTGTLVGTCTGRILETPRN
jgi:hypothetical protein